MTRCEFCGKSDDDPTETKTMVMNDRLYKCYCVTLEEYRANSEAQAYGNDCINGKCEV